MLIAATAIADAPFYANTFERQPSARELMTLGRLLFNDPGLSASGKAACATCHDPRSAFGPANGAAVQLAGVDGRQPGIRAVPSLMYAQNVPPFTEHFVDDEGDDSIDQGPAGGRNWDGRAQSAHEQAALPLMSPFEMANRDAGAVAARVAAAGYAARFRENFGDRVFDDSAGVFKAVVMALEAFQQDAAEFYPYSSKYDAWLRHDASLSPQEIRGLAAFNDPRRGNCARCHPSAKRNGAFPQFTDFGYAAVGVPRNAAIPANRDARYYDLGLCGPLRSDLADQTQYCGMFKTPTLRNVALRAVFFHNGLVHRLDDAVRFYTTRATSHADLPRRYRDNLDVQAPFDRRAGDPVALSDQDIADIVVFLHTLTDGHTCFAAHKPC